MFLLGAPPAQAQAPDDTRTARNSLFLEAGGPGGLYSFNYERFVTDRLALRAGFSYWGPISNLGDYSGDWHFLTVPLTLNYLLLAGQKSSLEIGGGITPIFAFETRNPEGDDGGGPIYGVLSAFTGYRYQPRGSGLQARLGIMLLASPDIVLPWAYLSLGASF